MTVSSTERPEGEFRTLDEIHAAALKNLPADVAVYLESGAGTEQTLRANREAFTSRYVIKPKPMSGVNDPKTNTTVLGLPLAVPVLTAPFGGDGLFIARLTGPGKVWLQTLTLPNLAHALSPYLGREGGGGGNVETAAELGVAGAVLKSFFSR